MAHYCNILLLNCGFDLVAKKFGSKTLFRNELINNFVECSNRNTLVVSLTLTTIYALLKSLNQALFHRTYIEDILSL